MTPLSIGQTLYLSLNFFVSIENSKSDYTLFQAATTIKEAIIRDWSLMNPEAVEGLRSFLLRYITNHITLQVVMLFLLIVKFL